jgi:hypothetical protein
MKALHRFALVAKSDSRACLTRSTSCDNVNCMELMPLAEQCMTIVAELRASCGQHDGILDDIDTQMVYSHMMHHRSCRASRLARLRQAYYNTAELERVCARCTSKRSTAAWSLTPALQTSTGAP